MAGKATVHGFEYEDDDVEASAATGIDDGDDEHITVSMELEITKVSPGAVKHIIISNYRTPKSFVFLTT